MLESVEEFQCNATQILSSIRPASTFLSVHHYLNNFGEVSDFSICFHVDYLKAVSKSKDLLSKYNPLTEDTSKLPFSPNHLLNAKDSLLASFEATLAGDNPDYTGKKAYSAVSFQDTFVKGIKYNIKQDAIHLWGFLLCKNIILPGNYPLSNSSALTLAKDFLRKMTPVGRFRQFKLVHGRFHKLVVEKLSIQDTDLARNLLDQRYMLKA